MVKSKKQLGRQGDVEKGGCFNPLKRRGGGMVSGKGTDDPREACLQGGRGRSNLALEFCPTETLVFVGKKKHYEHDGGRVKWQKGGRLGTFKANVRTPKRVSLKGGGESRGGAENDRRELYEGKNGVWK